MQFEVDRTNQRTPKKTSMWVRIFYQWILEQLFDNVAEYKDGFEVKLFNGQIKWLVPVINMIKSDWPEGQRVLNMKEGASTSKNNCRLCRCPTT